MEYIYIFLEYYFYMDMYVLGMCRGIREKGCIKKKKIQSI